MRCKTELLAPAVAAPSGSVMAAKAGSRSEVMGSRFTAGTAMYSARPPSSPVMPYSV